MNTRRREPSGVEERAKYNKSLGWNVDAGSILPAALDELKEYHDIRFGGVESVLQFINEMLDKWVLLIPSIKLFLEYSRLPEIDPRRAISYPSSFATPPPPQFSRPVRTQPPPPPPPPAPPCTPAPCPPPWCPPVRGAPAPSPVVPVPEPVADVFYNVEESARITSRG
jgi:hypothetical protein